ncbi:Cylicin-2, putative [Perkinsus marinus ATCC 50983]|uniref:Cylicin-2, putative n=1 Tax=Perkinsus marinus (strain ATCC 50983 / TXsc) TaxID=423536 RepID=C5L9W3_PERM5|nr:Cylicin-2, putative [Perkinsus marinus ATCC 50983]EER06219.1 Cylicin-2, putative [Perkinsus marinus ATCC 50983]|eukprot:XP_002774403.1 Cylicin-2, putative [Perkinsus marinus ATCC 50983]
MLAHGEDLVDELEFLAKKILESPTYSRSWTSASSRRALGGSASPMDLAQPLLPEAAPSMESMPGSAIRTIARRDRELPPMKLYTSKKAPLAFMAPWLVACEKPEMTFPPPEEPHVSTSADSVRRLSILSSLNMPSQEGADLEIDTTPALGAEGPKNTTPPRAGFFRKLMDIILWRSDKKPKRKHEEVEKVEEKRFAGTPAAKKRRRVSSEPPTTAATKRRWSVEEMQDEQDGQDGEGGKGGLWSEDEGAEVARGVEEMQDEQDEGVCVEIEEIVVEEVQDCSSTTRHEEDTPESEGEGMGEHAMDGEEDSVEEMQDEQDGEDASSEKASAEEMQDEQDGGNASSEEASVEEMQDEQDEQDGGNASSEEASVAEMQDEQDEQDGGNASSEEASVEEMQDEQDEQDGGNASSEEASVEEMQEEQDGWNASSEEASVEEMQDEQDGGNASSEEASVEEMQDEQDLLEDSSTVEDKVEKRQNQQDEEEEDPASEEPDDKKSISKAHGHDDAAAEGRMDAILKSWWILQFLNASLYAVVDDDASSIPSSPQLDFSSDENEDPHPCKVVVHDDISETERADLERHADAIAAALSEEEKHGR